MARLKKKHLNKQLRSAHQTKSEKGKYLVLFLGFLMVGSVFGVLFYGAPSSAYGSVTYKGYVFEQTNVGYEAKIDGEKYFFTTLPQYLEQLELESFDDILLRGGFVFSFDPEQGAIDAVDAARLFFARELPLRGIAYGEGVLKPSTIYALPVITCENASQEQPVVVVREANMTSITYEENCLIIEGQPQTITQYLQALEYKILGVL
ncbi:hypothetical protein D6774_02675 [Candidatus Woesearchaeota archaeon]|nr:MAG: hypothetical protein D6774_02675 [Candidatus Woesearchaeota archaeon]